jgi:hypothetical protein
LRSLLLSRGDADESFAFESEFAFAFVILHFGSFFAVKAHVFRFLKIGSATAHVVELDEFAQTIGFEDIKLVISLATVEMKGKIVIGRRVTRPNVVEEVPSESLSSKNSRREVLNVTGQPESFPKPPGRTTVLSLTFR